MFGTTRASHRNPWIETDRREFAKTALTALMLLGIAAAGLALLVWGLTVL